MIEVAASELAQHTTSVQVHKKKEKKLEIEQQSVFAFRSTDRFQAGLPAAYSMFRAECTRTVSIYSKLTRIFGDASLQ